MEMKETIDGQGSITDQGTQYTGTFYVLEENMPAVMAELSEKENDPSWLPEAFKGNNLKVKDYHPTRLSSDSWTIQVVANNYVDDWSTTGDGDLRDQVDLEYSQKSLKFPPQWFGLRKASCAEDKYKAKQSLDVKNDLSNPTSDYWPGKYNAYTHYIVYDSGVDSINSGTKADMSIAAKQGDYFFINATPAIYWKWVASNGDAEGNPHGDGWKWEWYSEGGTKGEVDYESSPFDTAGDTPKPSMDLVDRTESILQCTIVFYVDVDNYRIQLFTGISPQNNAFPNYIKIFDKSQSKWRAVDQRISKAINNNGNQLWKVTRTMEYAPFDLLWSRENNGGDWKW